MKLRERLSAYLTRVEKDMQDEPCDIPPEVLERWDNMFKRECDMCKHRGTMKCPPSAECYAVNGKPHFELKEEKAGFWKRLFKGRGK